ncbi:MAG: helix-turn-helix domain-containing protein [Hydrogenophaga sp.]|jgi:transcriptional regulator with XRE-family HTH domain|uniref:helix-turn-helix domain-containing protein n=1 Tax=Hydrogenophaga sp. TaxID=1904254 RepID=UPI004036509D
MTEDADSINTAIGRRVHELRTSRKESLETLASRSGVSRSMISLIERGEASPTAVVLDRLASALGISMAALFGSASERGASDDPLLRRAAQTEWKDPQSGYTRRLLTSPTGRSPLQLAEVRFPAGARVAYESGRHDGSLHQQVWVLKGRIDVAQGERRHVLQKGDCLAVRLDQPLVFSNPTEREAHYLVALCDFAAPYKH